MVEPVQLNFFHDVLCAFCSVTAERLRQIELEFGDLVHLEYKPFPLRLEDAAPSGRDLRRQVRWIKRAAKEPEGDGLSPSLWRGLDPPLSSLPPLVAAEAARHQGLCAQRRLLRRLREAALKCGVNVARRDVVLELASASGLDMDRFIAAYDAPATLRAVEASRGEALQHGVHALPSVVVGESWLLTGVRELHEYREVVLRWLQRCGGPSAGVLN